MLGDRDQAEIEKEALVVGRRRPVDEQEEKLGEARLAHQVAGEVAAANARHGRRAPRKSPSSPRRACRSSAALLPASGGRPAAPNINRTNDSAVDPVESTHSINLEDNISRLLHVKRRGHILRFRYRRASMDRTRDQRRSMRESTSARERAAARCMARRSPISSSGFATTFSAALFVPGRVSSRASSPMRFAVSRGPVREALRRLAAEG